MLFRRRVNASFWQRTFNVFLSPRALIRATQYLFKRLIRLKATPHAIAAGVAAGVFASCTPFMGLHFFVAFAIAFVLGGNLVASAIATIFGNPLTFPVIWATTFKFGKFILGDHYSGFENINLMRLFFPRNVDSIEDYYVNFIERPEQLLNAYPDFHYQSSCEKFDFEK